MDFYCEMLRKTEIKTSKNVQTPSDEQDPEQPLMDSVVRMFVHLVFRVLYDALCL